MPYSSSMLLARGGRLLAGLLLSGATLLTPMSGTAQVPVVPPDAAVGQAVDSIAVLGNRTFSEAALLGTIGLPLGQIITFHDTQEALGRLWATGRFSDIQIEVEGGNGDPVVLVFRVEEHPVVRSLAIQGLERINERDVWEHADLRIGEPYSPNRVMQARRFILDGLSERGIPFASVEERRVPIGEGEMDLVLEVTEGQRVAVAQVAFNGNDAFGDRELRSVLATRPEGFLWFRTGQFQEETLEEDLFLSLPEFYAAHGYLDFQVLGDTLIIDPATGKGRLEVDVSEGPQYRVASFSVTGNRRFPTEELERYYDLEEGGLLRSLGLRRGADTDGSRVFDQIAFRDATLRVENLYRNEGYLYVLVSPSIERLPPESDDSPPRVAVTWNIQEGQPAYVRYVFIEGNEFTHDRVIRERILLLPGDVYSEERLMRSYQGISGLGYFETPMAFPELRPDEQTGDLDIVFRVVERQTGSVNFGTTMGGHTGISGFIGYDQPNLFGQGKSGNLRWDFGRFQNNFSVQYTDPALFESRVSGTLSLFDSRDRFFSFASGERKVRGASTRFGFPVPNSFYSRFFTGYSLSRTEYRLRGGVDDTSLFARPPGTQSQLTLGIQRRTIDHPLFPTVGSEQVWTAEFTGGPLGGDGRYMKHRVEGSWWVPVGSLGGDSPGSRPIVFALGLKARAGTIFGDAEAFPFDRFWMGGVQFGERLRGYDETTITPLGYVPRGGGQIQDIQRLGDTFLLLGAQYAVRLGDMVSVSAFYEAGNVWRHPQDVDPSQLRRGAGLGIELVTPFGPIGLDYAYGFDRTDPGWELHFRMGGEQGF